jgi:hypothetical protein
MHVFGPQSGKSLAAKFQRTEQLREPRDFPAQPGKLRALFTHLSDCRGNESWDPEAK